MGGVGLREVFWVVILSIDDFFGECVRDSVNLGVSANYGNWGGRWDFTTAHLKMRYAAGRTRVAVALHLPSVLRLACGVGPLEE